MSTTTTRCEILENLEPPERARNVKPRTEPTEATASEEAGTTSRRAEAEGKTTAGSRANS
jgi:hypothetical protein